MTQTLIAAWVVMALAACAPAFAQGRGNGQRNGQSQGPTKASTPPSRNALASPVAVVAPPTSAAGATPLAWIDDATVLEPGTISLAVSALRWEGADLSEVDVPMVDGAVGLAPRVQLSGSVPRVVGSSDPSGAAGGVGTSFFTVKVGVLHNRSRTVKVAVAPTLQILGEAVATSLGSDEGRARWGFPVSAEIDRGSLRLYGGGGHFSPGLWFGGAAVGFQATPKAAVTAGFSRAWRSAESGDVPLSDRDRKELSGGASYALTPQISLFGSIGHTVATLEENGAGTTVSGGLSLFFTSASTVR